MEIVIHGTNGGYRVLYPFGGFSPIGDVRFNTIDESSVGQSAYSISFTKNGCVFTKYTIVRDVNRNYSLGNIAFSVLVTQKEKLSGDSIISLLDNLSDVFIKEYAPLYNLDKTPGDWGFVEDISKNCLIINSSWDSLENISEGTFDAAFFYFTSAEELKSYFDSPYKEEFFPYKQVFFVKSTLKNKPENPLNTLKHDLKCDLTGKIDLTRKYYKLKDFHGEGYRGLKIEIITNHRKLKANDRIGNRDIIKLKVSKSDWYKDINEEGKLGEEKIQRYLRINENEGRVEVKKDIEFVPIEMTRKFEFFDQDDKPVSGIDIKIGSNHWQNVSDTVYSHTFRGDEIILNYKIVAKKESEDLFSDELSINPAKDEGPYILKLIKVKKITINVFNKIGGIKFRNYNFWINDGKGIRHDIEEITFKGNEINTTWKIEVDAKLDSYRFSKTLDLNPAKHGNILEIPLDRKQDDIEEAPFSNNKKESWFERSKPSLIASAVVVVIIFFGYWLYNFTFSSNTTTDPQKETKINNQDEFFRARDSILTYLDGIELKEGQLEKYGNEWDEKKALISNDDSCIQIWRKLKSDIDNAVKVRNLINSYKFSDLKKYTFSSQQKAFKDAIANLNSGEEKTLKNKLTSIKQLDLKQIADSISIILKPKNEFDDNDLSDGSSYKDMSDEAGNRSTNPRSSNPEPKGPNSKSNSISNKEEQLSNDNKDLSGANQSDKTAKIIQYIRGNKLESEDLDKYLNEKGITENIKRSIKLCREYWKLNGERNNTYCSYKDKVEKDNNFKHSKLLDVLKKVCQKGESSYSEQDKRRNLENL